MIALAIGSISDLVIGDPGGSLHPVVWIGRLIGALEKLLYAHGPEGGRYKAESNKTDDSDQIGINKKRFRAGLLLWLLTIAVTVAITLFIVAAAYKAGPIVGILIEALLTLFILAGRSLYNESMKVYKALEADDIEAARRDLSMIVGRDTQALDDEGIIKASVETVAENTSDGVTAPLIFTALGGPVLGFMYKAVNTMDSMLGYKNERYEYFGKTAAVADDIFNYIPSRISAVLMICASALAGLFSGSYNAKDAFVIWKRDRAKHKSPNSAQTESVCAGALGIRLAGDAYYGGVCIKKPYIGDENRKAENADIKRANVLMFLTSFLTFILAQAFLASIYFLITNL